MEDHPGQPFVFFFLKVANVDTMSYVEDMQFEWDDRKNEANFKKHGIWFEEAATVIPHPLNKDYEDPDYPGRSICIGLSHRLRVLFVSYQEKKEEIFRIISARKATPKERGDYEKGI